MIPIFLSDYLFVCLYISFHLFYFVCLQPKTNFMLFSSTLQNLKYFFKADTEISLYNHKNNAYIKTSVCFKNLSDFDSKLTNKDIALLDYKKISSENLLDEDVISDIIENKDKLFVIVYDNNFGEVASLFHKIIYNRNILCILVERPIYDFIFKYQIKLNEKQPTYFTLKLNKNRIYITPLTFLLCLTFIFMTNLLCYRIMYKMAQLEPEYNDFEIKDTTHTTYSKLKGKVDDKCIICHEEYEETSKLRELHCNHAFHAECIDRWLLSRQHYCPVCRETVEITQE